MSQPAEKTDKIRFSNTLFGRPECLPVPAVALLLAILYRAGPDLRSWTYVYEPPWLLFCLNSVFITGLCLIVAGLSVRIYLRGGFVSILLLGCGVLALGLSSSAAGWLIRPPHGPNEALTIHNSGVLFASVCFFLSSLSISIGKGFEPAPPHRAPLAGAAYLMVLLSVALLTAATMLGSIPPFFVPGEGPTALRQAVLAVSVTLLAVSAALMLTVYAKRPSGFLLYTVVAILLLGMGLVGIALGPPGSPINWLGRVSQYLGNVYLVMAAVGALREAKSRGTTVEQALAAFFRTSETHFKALVEMAADAIVSIDGEGKILLMNPAAGGMFGYGTREAVGRNLGDLIVPEPSRELFQACLRGEPCKSVRMELRNRDGSILPVEMSFSPETRAGAGVARTIVIRDVTERKKAEEAVRSASLFPVQNPQPVLRVGSDGTVLFSNPAAERILAQWQGPVPDPVHRAVRAALDEGAPKDLEMRIAGRDFSFVVVPIPEGPYANLYGWDVTDRRRAEAALQESEERYRRLFESMNEGFALHEMLYDESGEPCDYRFLDVNPAFERLTGLGRQAVIGKTVSEVLPGTEPDWVRRYAEVVRTGKPAHFESRSSVLGRDYEVFAYRPASGQFAAIFMDITDRRQAEASLRASYALLRIAQRAAMAGIWVWEISTGKFTWSEEFYSLFGLDPGAEASFDAWLGVLHPDDRQAAVERIHRSIQERTPLENEYRIVRPDGEQRWIRALGSTSYDDDGSPLRMSGICIDVTEGRKAEEELRASEMRMKAVADHLPVGVWFADETGRILYGNEAGRRIWGGARYVEPSEFHVYRAWWADTGTPLAPEDWAVSRAVQKGETSLNEVIEIECFDGTRKTILNSAVPLKSPDGSLRGVVVLNEDISERVRAEQALQSARDELEEKVRERTMELMLLMEDLEKSRSDLRRLASELVMAEERERKRISVVLHDEVAQTLAATKMRLDLLRNMPGSDDFHRAVSEAEALIGESIRQTRALMTDITNPVLYDMGLRAAVEALAEDVSARRGIDFACRFAGNLAGLGQELDVMIFQVIKELVQNIVKHSGARSAGIRIAEEGKDVRVTVTDDGEGFDAAQIGPAGSEGGFGLFSIRERVKSYGGRIEIDSAPGNGSRVSVVLPKTAGRETRNGGRDRIVRP